MHISYSYNNEIRQTFPIDLECCGCSDITNIHKHIIKTNSVFKSKQINREKEKRKINQKKREGGNCTWVVVATDVPR